MLNQLVFEALNNPGNANIIPGTDRITEVLQALNNPQNQYKIIHITGTNGKGSTAAFIETGLCHAGYKVGKFSSPHIKIINECICLNQIHITDADIESNFYQVKTACNKLNIDLSPFEILTAIMFNYFAANHIEYLVLEVGMGGIDDATNVVDSLISIITNVSLEHTKFLGSTLGEIAKNKVGIIKDGLTIIADNLPELVDAVSHKTQNYVNILQYYNFNVNLNYDKFQTVIKFNITPSQNEEIYTLNLFGDFQAYNFLCAYHALQYLNIDKQSIKYAAENTKNPGRFEIRERDPLLILDATHNLAGSKALSATLNDMFRSEDIVIISSILVDKDVEHMLEQFSTIATNIICTTIANNPRTMRAQSLAHLASKYFPSVQYTDDPIKALTIARGMNKNLILVTGSLYLLGYF